MAKDDQNLNEFYEKLIDEIGMQTNSIACMYESAGFMDDTMYGIENEIRAVEKDRADLQEQLDNVDKQKTELDSKIADLKSEDPKQLNEDNIINMLRKNFGIELGDELPPELDHLHDRLGKLEDESKEIAEEYNNADAELQKIDAKLEALKGLPELEQQSEELGIQKAELEGRIAECDSKIQGLENDKDQLVSAIKDMDKGIAESNAKVGEIMQMAKSGRTLSQTDFSKVGKETYKAKAIMEEKFTKVTNSLSRMLSPERMKAYAESVKDFAINLRTGLQKASKAYEEFWASMITPGALIEDSPRANTAENKEGIFAKIKAELESGIVTAPVKPEDPNRYKALQQEPVQLTTEQAIEIIRTMHSSYRRIAYERGQINELKKELQKGVNKQKTMTTAERENEPNLQYFRDKIAAKETHIEEIKQENYEKVQKIIKGDKSH